MTSKEAPITTGRDQEITPKPSRRYRSRIFEGLLWVQIFAFGLLAWQAFENPYLPIDLAITRFVQSYHPPWLVGSMLFVSWFGYAYQSIGVVMILVGFLARLRLYWEAVTACLAAVFVIALNTAIKLLVHRPRPAQDLVHIFRDVQGYSFPSGHVMFYTGFFGFLFFLAFVLLERSRKRTLLLWIFGGMIVLVGISRVYLGDHWTSDVVGGYLLGSLSLWLIMKFYQFGKARYFVRQHAQTDGRTISET